MREVSPGLWRWTARHPEWKEGDPAHAALVSGDLLIGDAGGVRLEGGRAALAAALP